MLQFGKLVWFSILTNSIITQAQKETFITLSDILMKSQFKTFLVNPIKKQKSKSNLGNYLVDKKPKIMTRTWLEPDPNQTLPSLADSGKHELVISPLLILRNGSDLIVDRNFYHTVRTRDDVR